jgi:hypothetical protein
MKIVLYCMYVFMMVLFIISIICHQSDHITIYGILAVLTYLQIIEDKIDDLKK